MPLQASQYQLKSPKPHHQLEDCISRAPGLLAFARLPSESQKTIMRLAVASLEQIVLNKFGDGSTLNRVNIFTTKNANGEKVVGIAGCTVGDSPLILVEEREGKTNREYKTNKYLRATYLTDSHNLGREKMREIFKKPLVFKGLASKDVFRKLTRERSHWRHSIFEDIKKDHKGGLQGVLQSGIALGRSINDPIHKQDSDYTSEPETVTQEIKGPAKIILLSDGALRGRNNDRYEAGRPYIPGFEFSELSAVNIVRDAQNLKSQDDISAIVIDIPADLQEGEEFCDIYGVDDGHGGKQTAEFCSQYYYPIQHFWTLIYQAYHEAANASLAELQESKGLKEFESHLPTIQRKLIEVFAELHQQTPHISVASLLLHPKMTQCLKQINEKLDIEQTLINTVPHWEALFATPAEAYACILQRPKILAGLKGKTINIAQANGLSFFTEKFLAYLHSHQYPPLEEKATADGLANQQITDVFRYLLEQVQVSQSTLPERLKGYEEVFNLAKMFFGLFGHKYSAQDVRKYVKNFALNDFLQSPAMLANAVVARSSRLFNFHRKSSFWSNATYSVNAINEELQVNKIRGGLLSNGTKSLLVLGILSGSFAGFLHYKDGDFFNLLPQPQNSALPKDLEIGAFAIAGVFIACVVIRQCLAYRAEKELKQKLVNLPEYKGATVETIDQQLQQLIHSN